MEKLTRQCEDVISLLQKNIQCLEYKPLPLSKEVTPLPHSTEATPLPQSTEVCTQAPPTIYWGIIYFSSFSHLYVKNGLIWVLCVNKLLMTSLTPPPGGAGVAGQVQVRYEQCPSGQPIGWSTEGGRSFSVSPPSGGKQLQPDGRLQVQTDPHTVCWP